ncbi:glutamine--fructose-6-phosphate transaminase (isomerizing) [Qingshengfaniella alkalisoli]|uniref:Glutamine--fructose-6-phosphate aminotransferase [isomerizing] n=1 Tax=Qingshengfaniella alkalisoli TaxID=2599296 RepID=A0A5B8J9E4_9RHOB|nr:glutamine--fructose-6-phosphate transaminase (isomerizing) [Qingshengfaniella alkalisoli]QDY70957.1 glutamine--fructose-6-phosphate transaminase (isomerizing) [Qingshengfaniella alkalisoli]
MCGIVGVLGTHQVAPQLLNALACLEYRGYDSAGAATITDGRIERRRAVGKLVNLSDLLVHEPLEGMAGIGHTRWATHGGATVENAHPHMSDSVALVHNGIIENYAELREELRAEGRVFASETDTEVVMHLVARSLEQGKDPQAAVQQTLSRLRGAFALLFLFRDHPDLLIAARRGSPLALGFGEGEMYVGSDAIALAPMTDRVCYLEEGDWAVVTRAGATIFDTDGMPVERPVKTVAKTAQVDKAGYKHFMAKEIAEQPAVIGTTLDRYLDAEGRIHLPANGLDFARIDRISMVACGTASYACQVAKYWFEQLARLPVDVDIASEFRYREPPFVANTTALFVSQSGETADTLAALRYCAEQGLQIASLTNVPESSIARESDVALPIEAGVEIGVASTKAFTCQLTALFIMALKAAQVRGTLTPAQIADHLVQLRQLPGLINATLSLSDRIEDVSRKLAEARDVLFLGRGALYPLALEGALKLKEISYIHAEGYASGELKHGPIALIDRKVPVVVLAPTDPLFDKTVSNMQEVLAREGKVILITDAAGAKRAGEGAAHVITLPEIPPALAPILYAIPAQLLAYHTAVAKGTDVDQPRNLAKSVTVE